MMSGATCEVQKLPANATRGSKATMMTSSERERSGEQSAHDPLRFVNDVHLRHSATSPYSEVDARVATHTSIGKRHRSFLDSECLTPSRSGSVKPTSSVRSWQKPARRRPRRRLPKDCDRPPFACTVHPCPRFDA